LATATVNLGLLYTAKGASAFLVPVANMIKASTGNWHMVFLVTALMNLAVVGLALFVLKPMRSRIVTREDAQLARNVKTA
jgi:OFA family oxalate/formate antiporter-like MFS transporter